MEKIVELFIRGGPVMWPLLLCSIAALTVTIERGIFFVKQERKKERQIIEEIFRLTDEGRFPSVIALREKTNDPVAQVLIAGMACHEDDISRGMEVAADDMVRRMKRGLSVLDTIITLSPLLGILGTVIGIIESFDILGLKGIADPIGVVGGIAQALITTAAGLGIAILTLVPYNIFISLVKKETDDLQKNCMQMDIHTQRGCRAYLRRE
jgi:biopolymer transport protein ExbB